MMERSDEGNQKGSARKRKRRRMRRRRRRDLSMRILSSILLLSHCPLLFR